MVFLKVNMKSKFMSMETYRMVVTGESTLHPKVCLHTNE